MQEPMAAGPEQTLRGVCGENANKARELKAKLEQAEADQDATWKRAKRAEDEIDDCLKILHDNLDRDKDPLESLRDLVCVAINGIHWRDKERDALKAKLADAEAAGGIPSVLVAGLQEENRALRGMASKLGALCQCLEPDEDGRPACDPQCLACEAQALAGQAGQAEPPKEEDADE